jgi:hypothetical protein
VHGGQSVILKTSDDELSTGEATLLLGRWQIQVHREGELDLERVKLVNATGASALFSEGALSIVNCTFSRCQAQATLGPPRIRQLANTYKHTHRRARAYTVSLAHSLTHKDTRGRAHTHTLHRSHRCPSFLHHVWFQLYVSAFSFRIHRRISQYSSSFPSSKT